mmetsp:Transcript_19155/g.31348  ORF Transcript_19155/g.31348 Transcript_19155/m.31348 type:complete len:375 (-) Transcript_19155:255-1379(-)|eukprot:CAMPEP_0184663654 /NCGR_PEP_ID=MMETSP0308-20130426/49103_1 /TAXON_ID=38269 /ORGANISM="Gloeochaete witrockiana, Strain SAG 46.84" /LENGTH=374 /DNA_ID=CAMNT_0027106525 /DNA_START=40 /DNA_END=1164 /DNA_ORIENTATION=+
MSDLITTGCVTLLHIGSRSYRKACPLGDVGQGILGTEVDRVPQRSPREEFRKDKTSTGYLLDRLAEDEETNDAGIEQDPTTKDFIMRLPLSSEFYKYIIGKGGAKKKTIETETGATIVIPKSGSKQLNEITIRGPSEQSVLTTRNRIDIVVASALQSLPYTHFISIPLALDESSLLRAKLQAFYDEAFAKYGTMRGWDRSLFVPPSQLHLTILMLKLYSDEGKQKAIDLLHSCAPMVYDIVGTRSVIVQVRGLEYMNDDPHEVDILYAKLGGEGFEKLERFSNLIRSKFREAGLVDDKQDRNLKIHATIMNSKYRSGDVRATEGRISYDGSALLKSHGNIEFGSVHVREIHLSRRGSKNHKTQYYEMETSIGLP